jgi:hypothetical protein
LEKRKKSASAEPIHLVSNPDQLTEEERKAEANKQAEVAHLEASIKRLKLGLRQVMRVKSNARVVACLHHCNSFSSNACPDKPSFSMKKGRTYLFIDSSATVLELSKAD